MDNDAQGIVFARVGELTVEEGELLDSEDYRLGDGTRKGRKAYRPLLDALTDVVRLERRSYQSLLDANKAIADSRRELEALSERNKAVLKGFDDASKGLKSRLERAIEAARNVLDDGLRISPKVNGGQAGEDYDDDWRSILSYVVELEDANEANGELVEKMMALGREDEGRRALALALEADPSDDASRALLRSELRRQNDLSLSMGYLAGSYPWALTWSSLLSRMGMDHEVHDIELSDVPEVDFLFLAMALQYEHLLNLGARLRREADEAREEEEEDGDEGEEEDEGLRGEFGPSSILDRPSTATESAYSVSLHRAAQGFVRRVAGVNLDMASSVALYGIGEGLRGLLNDEENGIPIGREALNFITVVMSAAAETYNLRRLGVDGAVDLVPHSPIVVVSSLNGGGEDKEGDPMVTFKALNDEIDRYVSEHTRVLSALEELSTDSSSMSRGVRREIGSLSAFVGDLVSRQNSLHAAYEEATNLLRQRGEQTRALNERVKVLEASLAESKEHVGNLENQIEANEKGAVSAIERREKELREIDQALSEREDALKSDRKLFEVNRKNFVRERLEKAELDVERVKGRIREELRTYREDQERAMEQRLAKDKEGIEARYNEFYEEYREEHRKIEEKSRELIRANEQLEELEEEQRERMSALNDQAQMRRTIRTYEEEQELTGTLDALRGEVVSLGKDVDDARLANSRLGDENSRLKGKNASLSRDVQSRDDMLAIVKKRLSDEQGLHKSLEESRARAIKELATLRMENEKKERELDALRKNVATLTTGSSTTPIAGGQPVGSVAVGGAEGEGGEDETLDTQREEGAQGEGGDAEGSVDNDANRPDEGGQDSQEQDSQGSDADSFVDALEDVDDEGSNVSL